MPVAVEFRPITTANVRSYSASDNRNQCDGHNRDQPNAYTGPYGDAARNPYSSTKSYSIAITYTNANDDAPATPALLCITI